LHTSGAVGARIGGLSAPQLALHDLSIWALPFFLATAGYFHAAGAPAGGRPASWLGRRLARLAVPFLAFTALYRAYALQHFHERYSWFLLRHDLIYGTASAHLWFLPVLIWCSVIVWLVERTEWNGARGALLGVSAAGAVAYIVIAADAAPGAAYGYYLYRTPLFWLLFYVLGWELARRRGENAGQSGGRPAVRGAAPADGRPAARVAGPPGAGGGGARRRPQALRDSRSARARSGPGWRWPPARRVWSPHACPDRRRWWRCTTWAPAWQASRRRRWR
jgi:hypothetical protein